MIPKVIHYCWFGGKDIPVDVNKCIESWRKRCPDYIIRRWDESNFDIAEHPFTKTAYEAKAWAFVSDYARLKIIYENGGFYLDTDVELLKCLDELLREPCYFGVEQRKRQCNTGLGFGAEKNSTVIKHIMDEYKELIFQYENIHGITCPEITERALKKVGYIYKEEVQRYDGFTMFPPEYFDPYSAGKRAKNLMGSKTISIHHYSATWMGEQVVFRRKLIRLIGHGRMIKLRKCLRLHHKD